MIPRLLAADRRVDVDARGVGQHVQTELAPVHGHGRGAVGLELVGVRKGLALGEHVDGQQLDLERRLVGRHPVRSLLGLGRRLEAGLHTFFNHVLDLLAGVRLLDVEGEDHGKGVALVPVAVVAVRRALAVVDDHVHVVERRLVRCRGRGGGGVRVAVRVVVGERLRGERGDVLGRGRTGELKREHVVGGGADVVHLVLVLAPLVDAAVPQVGDDHVRGGDAHGLGQRVADVGDRAVFGHDAADLERGFGRVGKDKRHLAVGGLFLRELQGEVHVGVERHRHALAVRTGQLGAILSLEMIDDDGTVAEEVAAPGLPGRLLVVSAVRDHSLCRHLLLHAIQVFMDSVEKEGEELLRVVLAVSAELRCKLAQRRLELVWAHRRGLAAPNVSKEVRKRGGELATGAKGVVLIEVVGELPTQEEAGQRLGVAQALQCRIHETGVAKVIQPRHTALGCELHWRRRHRCGSAVSIVAVTHGTTAQTHVVGNFGVAGFRQRAVAVVHATSSWTVRVHILEFELVGGHLQLNAAL
mmetsp:Transcript_19595/g.46795  ORF Transcript_19595/g.46795 Transcript_19595/m.46795 type:complete len:527 (+) Transcript_19595:546-2126(+)